MRRFVEFYSEEFKRKVLIAIDISMEHNKATNTLKVEIPQQRYEVGEEVTYTLAKWEGE